MQLPRIVESGFGSPSGSPLRFGMCIYTRAGSIERSMVSHLPDLEPRLQRRYDQLVQEHVAPLQSVAAGLRALPGLARSFARTQAAWRFWANPRTDQ